MPGVTDVPEDAPILSGLSSLVRAFGLGEVRGLRFLTDGLMNRNWQVETSAGSWAVKQVTDVPLGKVRRNLTVLPHLSGEGLPVPAALEAADGEHVVEICGQGFCVFPWIEGTHVQGTSLDLDQSRELGSLLASLHMSLTRHVPEPVPDRVPASKVIDPAAATRAADGLLARFPADLVEVFEREAVEALHERKATLTLHANRRPRSGHPAGPYGWTHGDFQYRNLLRRNGHVTAILDWDRLAVRPYAEEVARTAQVQFGVDGCFDLERVAAFVSGYRSVVALTTDELVDAVDRLWWKRMTDFWQLEFHFDRRDPSFGKLFLADEALLHWWTGHLTEVRAAFTARSSTG